MTLAAVTGSASPVAAATLTGEEAPAAVTVAAVTGSAIPVTGEAVWGEEAAAVGWRAAEE